MRERPNLYPVSGNWRSRISELDAVGPEVREFLLKGSPQVFDRTEEDLLAQIKQRMARGAPELGEFFESLVWCDLIGSFEEVYLEFGWEDSAREAPFAWVEKEWEHRPDQFSFDLGLEALREFAPYSIDDRIQFYRDYPYFIRSELTSHLSFGSRSHLEKQLSDKPVGSVFYLWSDFNDLNAESRLPGQFSSGCRYLIGALSGLTDETGQIRFYNPSKIVSVSKEVEDYLGAEVVAEFDRQDRDWLDAFRIFNAASGDQLLTNGMGVFRWFKLAEQRFSSRLLSQGEFLRQLIDNLRTTEFLDSYWTPR